MTRVLRWFATWAWLAIAIACGGAPASRDAARAGATAEASAGGSAGDDSLAARAVAANAREQRGAAPLRTEAPVGFGPSVGFRSRERLDEHFEKHGAEFGGISREAYLRQAQSLRDAPVGGDILELRRGDGTVSRFDRGSGAFLAFDDDGTIRTFFKPNDGERYFRRQARRRAGG